MKIRHSEMCLLHLMISFSFWQIDINQCQTRGKIPNVCWYELRYHMLSSDITCTKGCTRNAHFTDSKWQINSYGWVIESIYNYISKGLTHSVWATALSCCAVLCVAVTLSTGTFQKWNIWSWRAAVCWHFLLLLQAEIHSDDCTDCWLCHPWV